MRLVYNAPYSKAPPDAHGMVEERMCLEKRLIARLCDVGIGPMINSYRRNRQCSVVGVYLK